MNPVSAEFWQYIDRLVAESERVIDRPKGSAHPRYPEMIYPLDYGYLAGTTAGDGHGIDIWVGSGEDKEVIGLLCTIDLLKRDMEIKLLLDCSEAEIAQILAFVNEGQGYRAMVIRRRAG